MNGQPTSEKNALPKDQQGRKYVLLKKKNGLSREAFSTYWRDEHGPLLASLPEFWRYTSRYIQNHVQHDSVLSPRGQLWDGVVECWQKPQVDYSRGFAQETVYGRIVIPDEVHFIVPNTSRACFAVSHVAVDGECAGVKILRIVRPRAEIGAAEFLQWRSAHEHDTAAAVVSLVGIRRYVQNFVTPMENIPADRRIDAAVIDEYWFDTMEAAVSAFATPAYRRVASLELVEDIFWARVAPVTIPDETRKVSAL